MNEDLWSGVARWTGAHRAFRPFYGGIGTILMFHRIQEQAKSPRIEKNRRGEVSPEFLETLIRFFRSRDYAILSLDEVHDILVQRRRGGKFVSFTFDDGYADAYTLAYPVFRKHGAPFAVYVSTGFPDCRAIMWPYLLEDLLLTSDTLRFTWQGKECLYVTETKNEREAAFQAVRSLMIGADRRAADRLLEKLFAARGMDLLQHARRLALSWDQIATMSEDPLVTIGAHTVNHVALNRLSAEEARWEIRESRKVIESRIGKKVRHFCYPFGSRGEVGAREVGMIRDAGFKTATTTRVANVFPGHARHLACLPRVPVRGHREDLSYLQHFTTGFIPALAHRFRRVVTL